MHWVSQIAAKSHAVTYVAGSKLELKIDRKVEVTYNSTAIQSHCLTRLEFAHQRTTAVTYTHF